jgi:nucleotide-binding universal stress UspA family protein
VPLVAVIGTDGSPEAQAAVSATVAFPWPRGTRVVVVVARRRLKTLQRPAYFLDAHDRACHSAAKAAERALRRRWSDATVAVEDKWAADAIIGRARRYAVAVIVLGSRRRGMAARLLLGSVSRQVVRRARCPVLIVRGRLPHVRRVVLGVDGSANSRRAVALLAALEAPRGGRVALVRVVEPLRPSALGLAPTSLRRVFAREVAMMTAGAVAKARRDLVPSATRLRRAGWHVRSVVAVGHPLPELLRATVASHAQLIAIGARGVNGLERLAVGSVAEGVLNRARVSVLVAR